jgi:phosphate uptake regulator
MASLLAAHDRIVALDLAQSARERAGKNGTLTRVPDMPNKHMLRPFEEELCALHDVTVALGELAHRQVERATESAERGDIDKATQVIAIEPEADAREHDIEGRAILLLALQAPLLPAMRGAQS